MEGWTDILEKIADLKESHPIETDEYEIYQNMQGEPTFYWRVPHVIKKRKRIILLVKKWSARYLKKTQKFGVRLPKILDKAYKLDAENGNVLWTNAIEKEMMDVKVAFKSLEDCEDMPIGYAYVRCHMIFDMKMKYFLQKSPLVAGGHMTDTPASVYATKGIN